MTSNWKRMRRQARSFCSAIFSSRYFDSFLPHDAYAVISAVFAIVRCLSVCQAGVCHVCVSCQNCWRYGHRYYEMEIRNHAKLSNGTISIFQWPLVTHNVDFMAAIFFNIQQLENGNRYSHTYNGRPTVSHTQYMIYQSAPFSVRRLLAKISRSRQYSMLNMSVMVEDRSTHV